MIRTHITKRESIVVEARDQVSMPDDKPVGFWYSVDRDWERWCESEMQSRLENTKTHRVTLGKEKILRLRGPCAIDDFHEEYKLGTGNWPTNSYIQWALVAKNYDGIEIAPYVWSRRLEGDASRWYYTWDCASGVIWRPKGVKVELVKEEA